MYMAAGAPSGRAGVLRALIAANAAALVLAGMGLGTAAPAHAGPHLAERVATGAAGRRLPGRIRIAGRTLLLRASSRGARYAGTADPAIGQRAVLTDGAGSPGDLFGTSMAMSGNTLVVGAQFANGSGGAAYVFTRPPGGWANTAVPSATLTNASGGTENLGHSVAISGGTIVVGAPGGGAGIDQGAAYVFVEPGTGWSDMTVPTATLTDPGGTNFDLFGTSDAVDGSTVVVSATGATYVFTEPGGGWQAWSGSVPTATLIPPGSPFVSSVAVAGTTVAVGASGVTVNGNSGQGAVYLWDEPGGWSGTPAPTVELTDINGAGGDGLGRSVAMNTTTVAAGALHFDGFGAVDVFTVPAGGWGTWSALADPPAELTRSSGSGSGKLGLSVALSGGTIVAGAPDTNTARGETDVFTEPRGGWAATGTPAATFASPMSVPGADFGFSVAAGGGTLAAGGLGLGAAYVYGSPPAGAPLGLGGFLAPRPGSRVRARSALRVAIDVVYPGGTPIPSSLASMLSASCAVTARASAAPLPATRCMRYEPASRHFSIVLKLGRKTGTVTIEVRLGYPGSQALSVRIKVIAIAGAVDVSGCGNC